MQGNFSSITSRGHPVSLCGTAQHKRIMFMECPISDAGEFLPWEQRFSASFLWQCTAPCSLKKRHVHWIPETLNARLGMGCFCFCRGKRPSGHFFWCLFDPCWLLQNSETRCPQQRMNFPLPPGPWKSTEPLSQHAYPNSSKFVKTLTCLGLLSPNILILEKVISVLSHLL